MLVMRWKQHGLATLTNTEIFGSALDLGLEYQKQNASDSSSGIKLSELRRLAS